MWYLLSFSKQLFCLTAAIGFPCVVYLPRISCTFSFSEHWMVCPTIQKERINIIYDLHFSGDIIIWCRSKNSSFRINVLVLSVSIFYSGFITVPFNPKSSLNWIINKSLFMFSPSSFLKYSHVKYIFLPNMVQK